MEILKRFLCDWGSSDSNMLLFFLLTSFLLGLLAGWLLWGSKIQAMLGILEAKEATITDVNTKLTLKEADLNKANLDIDALRLTNRTHEEEKGQLRVDLLETQNLKTDLSNHLAARQEESIQLQANLQAIQGENTQLSNELVASQAIINDLEAKLSASGNTQMFAAAAIVAPTLNVEPRIEIESVGTELQDEIKPDSMRIELTPKNSNGATSQEKINEDKVTIASVNRNDLKIVEGIGPKIEELCNNIGIYTWKQLSETPIVRLQEMLNEAGKRYQIHNPSTWAEQARMANENEWDALKIYQDHLKGGKEPDTK
jgi:predicted flap endonuclease-1-like 5' DNA nuclease